MVLAAAAIGLSGCAVNNTRPAAEDDGTSGTWTEWRGSTTPWTFGGNGCYTTRKAIFQGPFRIAVVVNKPASGTCQFSSLYLRVGRHMIPLSGLRGFKDTEDGKASLWAGNTGVLFFDADRIYTQQQLADAGLWENTCNDNACLTDSARVDLKRVPKQPQAKINRGAPVTMARAEYRRAYDAAASSPLAQQGFITTFTGFDPDNLVPQVANQLRQSLLDKGDWNSLVTAWENVPNKQVLQAMSKEAKAASRAKELESVVVAGIPPSALVEATPVSLKATQGKRGYESGKVDIQTYTKSFKGSSTIRLAGHAPVRLSQNKYSVSVTYTLTRHIEQFGAGWFTGDSNHTKTAVVTKTVELSPANKYSASVEVDFGELVIAYADRGTAGGYTRTRLSKEPQIEIRINSVSQVNS